MKNPTKFVSAFCFVAIAAATILFSSCGSKDPHKPPNIFLKTDPGYTSADASVAKGDTIKVGVVVNKTEDPLNTFNVSYVYDAATSSTTYSNESITGAEQTNGFTRDVKFVTRNQAGTEKWSFTVVDRDGNIASITIVLTVN